MTTGSAYKSLHAEDKQFLYDIAKDIAMLVDESKKRVYFQKQLTEFADKWRAYKTAHEADLKGEWQPSMGIPGNPLLMIWPRPAGVGRFPFLGGGLGAFALLAVIHDEVLTNCPSIAEDIFLKELSKKIWQNLVSGRLEEHSHGRVIPEGKIAGFLQKVKADIGSHFAPKKSTKQKPAEKTIKEHALEVGDTIKRSSSAGPKEWTQETGKTSGLKTLGDYRRTAKNSLFNPGLKPNNKDASFCDAIKTALSNCRGLIIQSRIDPSIPGTWEGIIYPNSKYEMRNLPLFDSIKLMEFAITYKTQSIEQLFPNWPKRPDVKASVFTSAGISYLDAAFKFVHEMGHDIIYILQNAYNEHGKAGYVTHLNPFIFLNKTPTVDNLEINPVPDVIIKTWYDEIIKGVRGWFPENQYPKQRLEAEFNQTHTQLEYEWDVWKNGNAGEIKIGHNNKSQLNKVSPTIENIDEVIVKFKALKKAKAQYRARLQAYSNRHGESPSDDKMQEFWGKLVEPILNGIKPEYEKLCHYVLTHGTEKFTLDAIQDMIFGGEFNYMSEENELLYSDSLINEFETVRENLKPRSAEGIIYSIQKILKVLDDWMDTTSKNCDLGSAVDTMDLRGPLVGFDRTIQSFRSWVSDSLHDDAWDAWKALQVILKTDFNKTTGQEIIEYALEFRKQLNLCRIAMMEDNQKPTGQGNNMPAAKEEYQDFLCRIAKQIDSLLIEDSSAMDRFRQHLQRCADGEKKHLEWINEKREQCVKNGDNFVITNNMEVPDEFRAPLSMLVIDPTLHSPKPKNKEEEYQRYYIILASIHDKMLPETENIDNGILPETASVFIRNLLNESYDTKRRRVFIEQALKRVKAEKSARQENGIAPKPMQGCEVMENYLHKIASDTEDIICDDAKKAQFLKSIEAYRGMREKFLQTLQQCKDEAVEKHFFHDEKAPEPPMGREKWEQGWELEEYLTEFSIGGKTVNKKFWRPPLPFDPYVWIMDYYGSPQYNYLVANFPTELSPKEPDNTENLICEYTVLAVIHDESRNRPSSQKLTNDNDEWVVGLWNSIKWLKAIGGDNFNDRTSNINQAIKHVESDLPKPPVKKGQKASGGKARRTKATNKKPKKRKPLAKTIRQVLDLNSALKNNPAKTLNNVNKLLKTQGFEKTTMDVFKNSPGWTERHKK